MAGKAQSRAEQLEEARRELDGVRQHKVRISKAYDLVFELIRQTQPRSEQKALLL